MSRKNAEGSDDEPLQPSAELAAKLLPSRQPWRRRGWITEIESWFRTAIQGQKLRVSRGCSLKQERNMHYSTVLSCDVEFTEDSAAPSRSLDVYLKSSYSKMSEALITKAVASHFPDIVPRVLLTRDDYTFVQLSAFDSNDVSEREILRALADLQIRSVDKVESLKAGVPYRGLDWHACHVGEVLRNPIGNLFQAKEFYKRLKDQLDVFQTLLAELASYSIPHTLVQGDFCLENVRADPCKPDSPRFIVWAIACIGYPLLDFFRITKIEFDGIRGKGATEIYLCAWKRYESDENIERALR